MKFIKLTTTSGFELYLRPDHIVEIVREEDGYGDNVVTAWMELPKAYEPKWIDVVNSHCKCPCCGDEWSYFENETERFKYCPNCGTELGESR